MKKIITNPIVDSIITLIIAYLLMQRSWFVGDFITINLPNLLGIDLNSIMGDDLYYTWFMYFGFIGIWICGLILVSLVKSYRPMIKVFSPKLKGNNIKFSIIMGLALGSGLILFISILAIASRAIEIHFVGIGFGAFVLLLISVFVQSGAEEFIARIFIYQRLRKNFPKWPIIAIAGNGLFFVAIHLNNPGISFTALLTLFATSVMYSLIVYYFDSIWVPIIAHTTWNFTQNIVLGLPNSGLVFPISIFNLDAATSNFAFEIFFGIEGAILAPILCILISVALIYFGRKKGAKETNIWEFTDNNNF